MQFCDCSFSNCNAQVKLYLSNWKNPVIVEWKNLNTGEEKTYRISAGMMIPSCQFDNLTDWITLSPSGRYIVMWYNKLNDYLENGELFIMIIDTETQQLTEGSSKDFGEFIDKSSKNSYHGSCCIRILDNGLLHIVTISESYENYIMDPKTNKVVLDIEKILESEDKFERIRKYGDFGYVLNWDQYFLSIATPESLFLIANQEYLEERNEVLKYDYGVRDEGVRDEAEKRKISFKKMSRQALRELAKNYTMFPDDIIAKE